MKRNISRISFIVHQNQLLNVSDNLICGISGGQDSILLLIILYHFKKLYKLELNNIYCNHLWQIKNFYTSFQILKLSYLTNTPVSLFLAKTKLDSEEQGHFWRQKTFFQAGNYFSTSQLILGHTLTDQIETAFWHLIRGTSPKGLISLKNINSFRITNVSNSLFDISNYSNIKFQRKNKIFNINSTYLYKKKQKIKNLNKHNFQSTKFKNLIFKVSLDTSTKKKVSKFTTKKYGDCNTYYLYYFQVEKINHYKIKRPLLNFSRSTINKLIQQNNLSVINDNTNQSTKLIRNKIRLLVFPILHYYIKPKCEIQIKNFLNISEIEQTYFAELSFKLLLTYLMEPELVYLLIKKPKSIKRICLNQLLQHYTLKQIKVLFINKFEYAATIFLMN